MSALDILIERILANANPSNMFWLKDNAVAATCELAELRAARDKAKPMLVCAECRVATAMNHAETCSKITKQKEKP